MTDGPPPGWSPPGPGPYGAPGPYGPPSQYGPPTQFGPPTRYGSPVPYGTPGAYSPPGPHSPYGPSGPYGQAGHPGQFGPWGGYGQLPFVPPPVKRTRHTTLLVVVAAALLVLGGVVAVASRLATPTHKTLACPPACGHPPRVVPVSSRPLYVGGNGAYSVRYDPTGGSIKTSTSSKGVIETWSNADGGVIRLFGMAASGRTAQQVAHDVVQSFPDAERAYAVPNAIVGYQPGYGEVDDIYPQSAGGAPSRERLIVMVAVKGNEALVGEALGPDDPATPGGESDDGHPTAAALEIAELFDPLINSFSWRGDPTH